MSDLDMTEHSNIATAMATALNAQGFQKSVEVRVFDVPKIPSANAEEWEQWSDKVKAKLRNPMRFNIAGYYGPNIQQEGACGEDDTYDPDYLERLIEALGGTPVSWECRTQSVGVPGLFSEQPTVLRQAAATISDAKSEGAEIIVSACTLSHAVLDVYQVKASRTTGLSTNIPVIHLTELLSFAFGHHNSRLAQLRTRIAVIGD